MARGAKRSHAPDVDLEARLDRLAELALDGSARFLRELELSCSRFAASQGNLEHGGTAAASADNGCGEGVSNLYFKGTLVVRELRAGNAGFHARANVDKNRVVGEGDNCAFYTLSWLEAGFGAARLDGFFEQGCEIVVFCGHSFSIEASLGMGSPTLFGFHSCTTSM